MKKNYVVGITGSSGVVLSLKLVHWFLEKNYNVDLLISRSGYKTLFFEISSSLSNKKGVMNYFKDFSERQLRIFDISDIGCPPCSGSYRHNGMIIVPCSMASVAAISIGLGDNALRRAADVAIKERNSLIIVPREAPFSVIHLENLLRLAKLGVNILPPLPQWYLKPESLDDIEDGIIGKILDLLKEKHDLYIPWTGIIEPSVV